jgi:hypothetical protein
MQRATERGQAIAALASIASVVALAGMTSRRVHAEAFTPSTPLHVTLGASAGAWSSDRGDSARTGRARKLPESPARMWSWTRAGARLDWGPVVLDGGGDVVAVYTSSGGGAATTMVRLHASDHGDHGEVTEAWSTKLGAEIPTTAPVVLADGAIAITLRHSQLVIVEPTGALRSRTTVSTGDSSAVASTALATGGVGIAIDGNLIAIDARGDVVQSIGANATTALASRKDGTFVALDTTGAVVTWTPGRRVTSVGALLSASATGAVAIDACVGGLVLDEPATGHARALCSARGKGQIVALDLVDGTKQVVASRALLSSRAGVAIGDHGDTVLVTSTGGLATIDRAGTELFAYDPMTALGLSSPDAGAMYGLGGEGAPLVDASGAVAFTNTDGVFLATGIGAPKLVTRCSGGVSTSGQSLASGGDRRLVVACGEGRIDLFGESRPTP